MVTSDGTLGPYCSTFLTMPADFTTTYDAGANDEVWDDEKPLGFKDIDADPYCPGLGEYSCGLYLWSDCSTPISSSHMLIENDRDIKMKRDVSVGFSYEVCYKCAHVDGWTI